MSLKKFLTFLFPAALFASLVVFLLQTTSVLDSFSSSLQVFIYLTTLALVILLMLNTVFQSMKENARTKTTCPKCGHPLKPGQPQSKTVCLNCAQ